MSTSMIIPLSRPTGKACRYRIFCFHWSGGNGYSFRNWGNSFTSSSVDDAVEVYGVTWRSKSRNYESIVEIARDLKQAFLDLRLLGTEIKTIFFG